MHPYYYHFHRGPSRILWFILGGVTAAWWMKRKEMNGHHPRYLGGCVRHPVQPAAINGSEYTSQPNHHQSQTPPRTQWPVNPDPPASEPIRMPFGWSEQQWEEEKERMWAMGQQAGATVRFMPSRPSIFLLTFSQASELSEATLDQVLSTVESLKAVRLSLPFCLSNTNAPTETRRAPRTTRATTSTLPTRTRRRAKKRTEALCLDNPPAKKDGCLNLYLVRMVAGKSPLLARKEKECDESGWCKFWKA